jgi:FSR family fosmidomycin resistance protein-like MFS transporter
MQQTTRSVARASAVIHGLVHGSVVLLPTLFGDLQRAFHVSFLDVVAAANVLYLVYGLAAIPAGWLADRVGSRTMLVVSAGGCGLALALVATAQTFPVLSVALVLLGSSAGIYHPSGLSLLSRRVVSGEQGRAIGIHGMGGNLGEALAPLWAGLFAARLGGWRWGFALAALLSFACVALAFTLPADTARAHRHPSLPQGMSGVAAALRSFWRSRPLRWLLLATFAGGFVYRGVLTYLPLHLSSTAGGTLGASTLMTLVLLAGLFAQRFGGELADRLPRERLFLTEVALLAPVLVLLGLTSGVGLVAMALSFYFLWYLAQPLASALAAAYADTREHGLLYGAQFAVAFGLGSFATTIGGLLVQAGGTSLAFLGFGAVAILQLVAALALVRSARAAVIVPNGG